MLGKGLSMSCRNLRPRCVFTFVAVRQGGLCQIVLRRRACFCGWLMFSFSVCGSYVSSVSKLHRFSASLYNGFAALNVCSSHDSLLIRLLIDFGNCRRIV